ncbi:hypothetical protein DL98DRAFT_628399, partial [Cadophora sp. DSE1049]
KTTRTIQPIKQIQGFHSKHSAIKTSIPPAYTSQPPMMPNLPSNAGEHSLSSSLPPYSSQLPANHVTVPSAQVAAMIPTNRPPHTQVPQPIQPQPQSHQQVVQYVTPPAITPQSVIRQMIHPHPYPQPQPQPQSHQHLGQPLPDPAPYYLINDMTSSPVLPAGPYLGPIPYPYPYTLPPSPYLPGLSPPQTVFPYPPTYPSHQPQVPVQLQQQPQVQLQLQQLMITHQGMPFQEHGYPGPGSLPPGGRWAVTTESDGRKTLWTIMAGETRPSGWAYE